MVTRFRNRAEAGRQLASELAAYANRSDVVVLGLPRGGVPVAFEIAKALQVPLDICLVRKLGVPGHEELAMGAIGPQQVRVLNASIVQDLGISLEVIEQVAAKEQQELERRQQAYRGHRLPPDLRQQTVIVVDDGIATGATFRAAIAVLQQQHPARIVVAVPIAAPSTCKQLQTEVDEVVCLMAHEQLHAIGLWYDDFSQTTDQEVRELLATAQAFGQPPTAEAGYAKWIDLSMQDAQTRWPDEPSPASGNSQTVEVPTHTVTLAGTLTIPEQASGLVLFAHGSGSSRLSPRNQYVAQVLQQTGLATLLVDLLTPSEEVIDQQTRHLRFDIGLLAERLLGATDWLRQHPPTRHLRIGYFGASTGAGAALVAAAEHPAWVSAVVSRGGRPDLAGSALSRVRTPTLLIVGGLDTAVIQLNQVAQAKLQVANLLEIVPGATHLFEEPGTLEMVAQLASQWFSRYLIPSVNMV